MLRRRQVGLPETNIASELIVKDRANVEDNDDCHSQMSPISVGMLRSNISPCKLVEPRDIPPTSRFCPILECPIFTTRFIQWQKHRKYQERQRNKDLEEHSQVSQEEVGIQAAFLDELGTRCAEHGPSPSEQPRWRRFGAFSVWDEICSGLAVEELKFMGQPWF